MVPVRVLLENFLTYEEAVFDFRGAVLWSIWGDNGAGKSAIFDAITYCLFGVHRGGAAGGADADLLRRGATRMSARFELELDGTLYRVTRTLARRRRRTGAAADERTQQVDWFDPDDEVWRAVPGTEARGGLTTWVREKVGLGYDTFVASALLLQGQSERLLQARPDHRFSILGDLIELDEYERLEAMAREEARDARGRAASLESALAGMAAVGDEELAAAESAFAEADAGLAAHREKLAQAARLVEGAAAYRRQVAQAEVRRSELRAMDAVLADAAEIRRDAREHAEVAAATQPVADALAALAGADRAASDAAARRADAAAIDVAGLETACGDAEALREEAARAAAEAAAAPGRLRSEREGLVPLVRAAARLAELGGDMERGAAQVAALDGELAELPAVSASLTAARSLVLAGPLIGQLLAERRAAGELLGRLDGEDPAAALERSRGELDAAVAAEEAARRDREPALARRHERQAAVALLERTVAERRDARTEGTCSHCGQRVDAAHIEAELRSAEDRLASARDALGAGERDLGAAERALAAAAAAVEQRRASERDVADVAGRIAERGARIERAIGELDAVPDLPAWAAVAALAPLEALPALAGRVRDEAAGAASLQRERERLLEVRYRRDALAADLDGWRAELAGLEAASGAGERHAAVARDRELATLAGEADGLAREAGQRWEERRQASERARRALDAARARHADLAAVAGRAEAEAAGLRREAALRLEPVPAAWRERALARDAALPDELRGRLAALFAAPARAAALDQAERDLGPRQELLHELEEALERTPPAHRVPVEDAERIRDELDTATAGRQEARDLALQAREQTRRLREERRELERRVQAASLVRRRWERLARLLGRGGLQARLMDDALAGIQQYANETLRPISNGQLEVRLTWNERGEKQEIGIQAVDLASSDEPMDVAFISGGQKFRTAVALAAGIGRYAGGAQRSLVIDEGFGSLDQQGRHQVIEQLRAIASVMDRVIVVSHHEDFQDRRLFPAGYVLRKDGRRTMVERAI